ncbi:MAG: BspA family leucine-rich repeat surface protein, partial [Phocaeicola sp.]
STAAAEAGYEFVGWYEGSTQVGAEATLSKTLSSTETGKTYTARFEVAGPNPSLRFNIGTTSASTRYTLPFGVYGITGYYTLTVDWGDGSEVQTFPALSPLAGGINHTYAAVGEYTITIMSSEKDYERAQMPIVSWENDKLLMSINTPLLNTAETRLSSVFSGCTSLTSIPGDLFKYFTAVTSFSSMFSGCTSLAEIPGRLFAHNTGATSFSFLFSGCTSLTSIPVDLFASNSEVANFGSSFSGCTSLTEIPGRLFANNEKVTNFGSLFEKCTLLNSIPEGLFKYNTAVTDFGGVFNKCSGLETIPADLFVSNREVTDFSWAFSDCSSLTSIPAVLFASNTKVTTFYNVFYQCSSLTEIPPALFANNREVTNFRAAFYLCTSLTEIPAGLFANNRKANDFVDVLRSCIKAKVNPNIFCNDADPTERAERFKSVSEKINFTEAFYNLGRDLSPVEIEESILPALWNYTYPAAGFISTGCFTAAKASNSVAVGPGWK